MCLVNMNSFCYKVQTICYDKQKSCEPQNSNTLADSGSYIINLAVYVT